MKALTSTVFLLAGLGLLGTAKAGPGHWTITGPDGGQSLSIAVDATNGVKINGASVVTADVAASNGVIHVIDTVLLPASVM